MYITCSQSKYIYSLGWKCMVVYAWNDLSSGEHECPQKRLYVHLLYLTCNKCKVDILFEGYSPVLLQLPLGSELSPALTTLSSCFRCLPVMQALVLLVSRSGGLGTRKGLCLFGHSCVPRDGCRRNCKCDFHAPRPAAASENRELWSGRVCFLVKVVLSACRGVCRQLRTAHQECVDEEGLNVKDWLDSNCTTQTQRQTGFTVKTCNSFFRN